MQPLNDAEEGKKREIPGAGGERRAVKGAEEGIGRVGKRAPAPFFVEPSSPHRSCQPASPWWEIQGGCNNGPGGSFIGYPGFSTACLQKKIRLYSDTAGERFVRARGTAVTLLWAINAA